MTRRARMCVQLKIYIQLLIAEFAIRVVEAASVPCVCTPSNQPSWADLKCILLAREFGAHLIIFFVCDKIEIRRVKFGVFIKILI